MASLAAGDSHSDIAFVFHDFMTCFVVERLFFLDGGGQGKAAESKKSIYFASVKKN